MTTILDGRRISKEIKEQIKEDIEKLNSQRRPKLAVILVGEDPASATYVASKQKACEQAGILSVTKKMEESVSQQQLMDQIDELNNDETIDGILIQLPLPKHMNEREVMVHVDPEKDVDGFHPINVGKLHLRQSTFVPATPKGVMELIKAYQIDLTGKRVVVIGRSHLVGRPLAQLLVDANATVTIAHSKTTNLEQICFQSEVIVAAVGVMHLVQKEWLRPNTILIDVGIHRTKDNKLTGDIDPTCKEKALFMTPVPGGIGPMTIAMLLKNTMQAYRQRSEKYGI
jgi:methylenetetrahydrofolate dehydrogenase (NADP+) / methenyltetrahydrofolate cyclohydrolase